jgi:MATE family multidrug resistance protein
LLPLVSESVSVGALATSYCGIRSLAIPIVLLSTAIAQYRQALGDSGCAMRAALAANFVNLPLNTLFIFGFEWGSDGAAWASVLSRVAELAVLYRIQRAVGFGWRSSSFREALRALSFGLPTGFERWLDVAAFAALVALLARMGAVELAAHQIALQILHFAFLPMIAVSEAVSVLVAQATGARQPRAARDVFGFALRLGLAFGALFAVLLIVFDGLLVRLFSSDPALVLATKRVLWVAAALQLFHIAYLMVRGVLRGLGDLRYVAWVTVGCAWLLTPPLTWLFGYGYGLGALGGWLALCAEVIAGLVLVSYRLKARAWLQASA